MTSQWNTRAFGKGEQKPDFAELLKDESGVILLQGKNTFGDRIYSYLKLSLPDLHRLQAAMKSGQTFNPSDFGTVVAAGKGEPPPEVHAEIAATYKVLDSKSDFSAEDTPPPAPKAWDEY